MHNSLQAEHAPVSPLTDWMEAMAELPLGLRRMLADLLGVF